MTTQNIDFTQVIPATQVRAAALAEHRLAALETLRAALDATAARITGEVPLTEMLSWGAKEEAARTVLKALETGVLLQPPIIAGEAAITGEAVPDLARRIIRNADAYRAVSSAMAGLRRKAEGGIAAAASAEEIAAVMAMAEAGLAQILSVAAAAAKAP